jgi:hypothetical protein
MVSVIHSLCSTLVMHILFWFCLADYACEIVPGFVLVRVGGCLAIENSKK